MIQGSTYSEPDLVWGPASEKRRKVHWGYIPGAVIAVDRLS